MPRRSSKARQKGTSAERLETMNLYLSAQAGVAAKDPRLWLRQVEAIVTMLERIKDLNAPSLYSQKWRIGMDGYYRSCFARLIQDAPTGTEKDVKALVARVGKV